MAKALDVARCLIRLGNRRKGENMTNLRLQKLLYFGQLWSLRENGEPLFEDEIEAWPYGPVVPAVYHAYKSYGNNPIPDDKKSLNNSSLTSQDLKLLFDLDHHYMDDSSSKLVRMSHEKDSPYDLAEKSQEKIISLESMKSYCQKMDEPQSYLEKLFMTIPVVSSDEEFFEDVEGGEWL